MKRITEIWFDESHIFGKDEHGNIYKQSLLWYPHLKNADKAQRERYTIGYDGFHWRELDEDVSFESFEYDDAEPTPLQRFFMTHTEINVAEFSKKCNINATLMRNYINGFKKPSKERENLIFETIHNLGKEYINA